MCSPKFHRVRHLPGSPSARWAVKLPHSARQARGGLFLQLSEKPRHAAVQNAPCQRLGIHWLRRSQRSTAHSRLQVVKRPEQGLGGPVKLLFVGHYWTSHFVWLCTCRSSPVL